MVNILYGTEIHSNVDKQTYRSSSDERSYGSSDAKFLLILTVYDRSIFLYSFAKYKCCIVRYKDHLYGTRYGRTVQVSNNASVHPVSGHFDFI